MTTTKVKSNLIRNNFHSTISNSLDESYEDVVLHNAFELLDYPILFNQHDTLRFNDYAQKIFGYTNDELIALRNTDIIKFHSYSEHIKEKRGITVTKKDGKKYKFFALYLVFRDIETWFLFNDDEHAILEENVSDRNKILSIIYENTSDAMALINVDGPKNFSFLSVNQTFTEVSGLTKEKCIGNRIEDVFPQNILDVMLSSVRWISKNGKQLNTEVNILLRNEMHYFESSLIPILNKSGESVLILLVAHDITERKKKEDELLKAKNEAEESSRLKATLLANMSHEVRTPLTGILGFAELLEEELDNPEHLILAQSIRSSGKRLLYTLNSIIELSRLEADKIEIYKRKLDLKESLMQLMRRFKPEAEAKGLAFNLEVEIEANSLHLDSSLFNQIMINLIDNAIKFTKNGSIKIVVEKEDDELKSFIVIKIIDTGIGISKNNLKTIFKEFKQESEGWGRSHEGIGLGLSLVKRMTELMSGSVSVQSEKSKGSTFTVRFPIFSESPYDNSGTTKYEALQSRPQFMSNEIPTVLLVEDNDLNITLSKLYLKYNYNVEHASNAYTALRMINEKKYSAILMDINLGDGMNGVDALFEIRKNIEYQKTPVIALTGYAIGIDEQNLLSCGFTGYLSKPFEKSQLLNILDEVLTQVKDLPKERD
jgi:PAS domain S-box-containing protein